jgi:hypothetical protein
MMKKVMVSVTDEMFKALDKERRARLLDSVPETIRSILGEYFKVKSA